MTLEELLLREEIKDLKARYCRFLDTKDWNGMESLFTKDFVLDVAEAGEPAVGRDAALVKIKWAVSNARTTHHVHSPEIKITGENSASAIWAMQDRVVWAEGKSPIPPVHAITGWGHYHEHYRKELEVWKIASVRLTRLNVEQEIS